MSNGSVFRHRAGAVVVALGDGVLIHVFYEIIKRCKNELFCGQIMYNHVKWAKNVTIRLLK